MKAYVVAPKVRSRLYAYYKEAEKKKKDKKCEDGRGRESHLEK